MEYILLETIKTGKVIKKKIVDALTNLIGVGVLCNLGKEGEEGESHSAC